MPFELVAGEWLFTGAPAEPANLSVGAGYIPPLFVEVL
jgi:hypothetical protein